MFTKSTMITERTGGRTRRPLSVLCRNVNGRLSCNSVCVQVKKSHVCLLKQENASLYMELVLCQRNTNSIELAEIIRRTQTSILSLSGFTLKWKAAAVLPQHGDWVRMGRYLWTVYVVVYDTLGRCPTMQLDRVLVPLGTRDCRTPAFLAP